ncbi:MAG: hypothetical protein AB7I18_04590 [Candidatus Berkiella sp.]
MRLSIFNSLLCIAVILFASYLPIPEELYWTLFVIAVLFLEVYSDHDEDAQEKLDITLVRESDNLVSYHIINHSKFAVSIQKLSKANRLRLNVKEITEPSFRPHLPQVPTHSMELRPRESISGNFNIDNNDAYFYVRSKTGHLYVRKIR